MPNTVFEAFLDSATAAPGNAFLAVPPGPSYAPQGAEISYGEAKAEVARLAALYRAAGYGHGHRVAVLLENRPQHFLHLLALNAIGASQVPINPDYSHDEMLYQMQHS